MSKYVPDLSSRRWVIIAPSREGRPDTAHSKRKSDPFDPANKEIAEQEVFRIGAGEKEDPGWKVRVIANMFPITDYHEVVIHSPDKEKDIYELPLPQVEYILQAYRQRFNVHKKNGQVLIFSNHGEHAGASISHPHSQIVVLPPQINLDALTREPLNNIVVEQKHFIAYCPDFSQWPYEVWIVPKNEKAVFGDITDPELKDLAALFKEMACQLHRIYKQGDWQVPFGYNYYINPKENWYLRLIPRFVHRAGFELGTGLSVNIVDPVDAAISYKGFDPKVHHVLTKLKAKF